MRPKNAVLFNIFFSIQVEIEPQNIKKRLGYFCNVKSHQTFNFGINVWSFAPIHDISSSSITVGLLGKCCAKYANASLQSLKVKGGSLKCSANLAANASRCVCAVISGVGG